MFLIRNIGNARFTWNQLLGEYQKTYKLFKQNGYTRLKCNMTTFNTMLNMLKKAMTFSIAVSLVVCSRFIVIY